MPGAYVLGCRCAWEVHVVRLSHVSVWLLQSVNMGAEKNEQEVRRRRRAAQAGCVARESISSTFKNYECVWVCVWMSLADMNEQCWPGASSWSGSPGQPWPCRPPAAGRWRLQPAWLKKWVSPHSRAPALQSWLLHKGCWLLQQPFEPARSKALTVSLLLTKILRGSWGHGLTAEMSPWDHCPSSTALAGIAPTWKNRTTFSDTVFFKLF